MAVILNFAGLTAMWLDKRNAVRGRWRIRERTLLLLAAVGGSIGVLIGMRLFRHKTQHPQFAWGVPFIIIMQFAAIAALLRWAYMRGYM
ncbi:MAG: DUF1294 domain-containing protein [Planctomycetes bacterium]|nr:DUF1294 domain-containing protein [Planctomycetota bacterium]